MAKESQGRAAIRLSFRRIRVGVYERNQGKTTALAYQAVLKHEHTGQRLWICNHQHEKPYRDGITIPRLTIAINLRSAMACAVDAEKHWQWLCTEGEVTK